MPRRRSLLHIALPVAGVLVCALAASPAAAQSSAEAEARAKYDVGAAAYEAKDFARAARAFTEADTLAPNPVVLKLALAAATQADDPVLSMTLVQRAESRSPDSALAEIVRRARARFEERVGRVRVVCAVRRTCRATVEGHAVPTDGELVVVAPGPVDAELRTGERSSNVHVVVAARAVVELVEPPEVPVVAPPPPPPRATATPEPPDRGLPRGLFWSGVALTGGLGTATVISGVDTQAKHDTYADSRSPESRERGVSAETRTNVLLLGTIAAALVTSAIGVFFTQWHDARKVTTSARR